MTREEKIEKAVRKWFHLYNIRQAKKDAACFGPLKAIARQGLFVKCVRMTFEKL